MSDGLTLEKSKVVERLSSLESKVDVLVERVENHKNSVEESNNLMRENIEKINKILLGDGGDFDGVVHHVKLLSKHHEEKKKHIWALWAAMIAGAVSTIFNWLTKQ